MRRRETQYEPAYEPLAKRLGRFVGLLGALFVIALAVIVTQRLSRDSLALLVGLSCGVMAMLPTLVLGFAIWRRSEARHQEPAPQRGPYGNSPPVVVVTPQALPGYQNGAGGYQNSEGWSWMQPQHPSQQQRSFTIVGGEE
jgi:hypothetical protein